MNASMPIREEPDELLDSAGPLPGDTAELYAVRYGVSRLSERHIFRDGDPKSMRPIAWSFYVARKMGITTLVDVGFRDTATAAQWGVRLLDVAKEMRSILDPLRVDTVCITHGHFDHVDNLDLYPNARVVVAEATYQSILASGSHATRAAMRRAEVIRTTGQVSVADGMTFSVVDGHTPGSSVVTVGRRQRDYVITGDECYLIENVEAQRPIGVFSDAERNTGFLAKALSERLIPLPSHDPEVFIRYPLVSPNIARIF
ncbi:MBL fold metallo-hydrolase [Sinomonas sp. JGH33]|uniref:MBL fold metallo-hydrolase n=1 Tax=Sinomonas terricola TaxID=3110330 RepID=A0ABU5TC66_9MICC|nr:MBL fold metallo-hydrolase [Sinomonas sp. JGH33]MEA5457279.1 MBL fold metallo-hydrolase [Sinomonas sp. JGH33]